MIRKLLRRRKIRREFGKLVDPKTFDELSRDLSSRPIKSGRIDYVLAFVRGENPAEISERVARVADFAATHNAMVYNMVGALVIMAFGTHPTSSPSSTDRPALVHALYEQLGADIKILHGAADGYFGLFGRESCLSYTFLVPHFDRMLAVLGRLQFGETKEYQEPPSPSLRL
jgi:hypothetical protein